MPNPWSTAAFPDDLGRQLPNPQNYYLGEPDVVTDNVTGLVWQRAVPPDQYDWTSAVAYCDQLALAGRSDWRLPARIELLSLIDFTAWADIDGTAFPDTPADRFWTCSQQAKNPVSAWAVVFNAGFVATYEKQNRSYVRCVTGRLPTDTPPPDRYAYPDASQSTVRDVKTGLVWQRQASPTALDWGSAIEYCRGLGPEPDWRLPSYKELETLVDETLFSPTWDPATFPDAPDGSYWTSSAYNDGTTDAYFVAIGPGHAFEDRLSAMMQVRCVR
jgi:hypothetical protein